VAIAVTRRRERYIDGLRACAAIHVLLNHCFLEVYPSEFGVRPTGVMHITREMSVSGLGVAVFIVLSGYSLAMSVHRDGWRLRDGTRAFLRRRARRLMPPYYAALLITLVLSSTVISKQTGTHWDSAVPFDARDVIGHLLLVQNVVGDPYTISHPLWSIAMTWHVYVAMPLILIAVRRWGVVATAAVAIVVTTAIAVGSGHNQQVVLLFRALQLFGLFTVGLAALAVSRADGVLTVQGRELRPPWTLIGVTWLAIWLVARVNHVPFGIGVACLIVAMSQGGARPLRAVLEWRPLVWLGTISFSLYLVHGPIIHLVWLEILEPQGFGVGRAATFWWLVALAPAAAILCAWGFYHAVEQRSLPRGSLARRRAEVQAAPAHHEPHVQAPLERLPPATGDSTP
jgi:peptidoglycan/LPS O-acetylase OafA/YrhL